MIAAVTGGTGFIGRRLVDRLLARGDEVRVLSRRAPGSGGVPAAVRWFGGDLASEGADLASFLDGADVVFHCAGELRDPDRMRRLHVEGTARLAAAAAGRVGHWVQLSSTGAYGRPRAGVITEESPEDPRDPYEETKCASDRTVAGTARDGGFSLAVLRPSIVYGPEMPNASLRGLVAMIARGLFFFIGPPGASANYVHVTDVAEALVACATAPAARGETFILSDHRTLEALVATVADELGRPVPRTRLPEAPVRILAGTLGRIPGFPLTPSRVDALTGRVLYSTARIERVLHHVHAVRYEDGMREVVRAWRPGRGGAA